jgi:ABC-type uncharacterized transport system substrate-binding protein
MRGEKSSLQVEGSVLDEPAKAANLRPPMPLTTRRGGQMRRRDVFIALAGASVIFTRSAFAEPSDQLKTVAVLVGLSESDPDAPRRFAAFRDGMQELGWFDGRNIRLVFRQAGGIEQIRTAAKQIVDARPDLIVASSSPVITALMNETSTIPIVFVTAADPLGDGFVQSLARPGGNATGFTNNIDSIGGKWLELLIEIAPHTARVAVIFNQDTAPTRGAYFLQPIEAAGDSRRVSVLATPVRNDAEIEDSIAELGRNPGSALLVMADNFTTVHRAQIIASALRHRVPAVYPFRFFAAEGGLMSYGADLIDLYRQTPSYVDRILRGAKPADLPVLAPSKLEFVINLKTAAALGLTVPRIVLARANEVIE